MEELRIVLLGRRGAGKSSAGNTLLGSKAFHAAASSQGVTQNCIKENRTVDGQNICVVDTPGWTDFYLTDDEPMQEIVKCIDVSDPGPHVLLLVLPIGRFTREEIDTAEQILEVFGEEANKYMMVLFTKGDDLEEKTMEEYLKGVHPDLKKVIEMCGGRYHVFNNRDIENHEQVSTLLKKIERMVEGNKGKHYTKAMYKKTAEDMKVKREKKIIHLRLMQEACEECMKDSDLKSNDGTVSTQKEGGNHSASKDEIDSDKDKAVLTNLQEDMSVREAMAENQDSKYGYTIKSNEVDKIERKNSFSDLGELKLHPKCHQSIEEKLLNTSSEQKKKIAALQEKSDEQKIQHEYVKEFLREMRKEIEEQKTEHENMKKVFQKEMKEVQKEVENGKKERQKLREEVKQQTEEIKRLNSEIARRPVLPATSRRRRQQGTDNPGNSKSQSSQG